MIYLSMDVHKDSITIAVLPDGAKAPTRLERLANDLPKLKKWLDHLAREGELHACYEASGAGYAPSRVIGVHQQDQPSMLPRTHVVPRLTHTCL